MHHTKLLGIIIDENLDWMEHANHCKQKITSAFFALMAARSYLAELVSIELYCTLVYPCLLNGIFSIRTCGMEYCLSVPVEWNIIYPYLWNGIYIWVPVGNKKISLVWLLLRKKNC